MRLTYRSATPQDIDVSFERLGEPFAYEPSLHPHVPTVWRHLLVTGRLATTVIEDHDRPPEHRIIGFGASVFISDTFMEQVRRSAKPYLRAQFVRNVLAGNDPVLDLIAAQQAHLQDGLNLFFVNDVLGDRTLTVDERRCVHAAWSEPLYALRACRLKEIVWECYGEATYQWARGCGLLLRHDWSEFWRKEASSMPPAEQRPYCIGLTRAEAIARPGTHASFPFQYAPARFSFTARQQELLDRSLRGETDEELARSLSSRFRLSRSVGAVSTSALSYATHTL